jgi:hypothetical protein
MGDGPPKQKLLRITFFLLRHHDAPHDADHEGYDQDDPDDHVNWSVSVAPTIHLVKYNAGVGKTGGYRARILRPRLRSAHAGA